MKLVRCYLGIDSSGSSSSSDGTQAPGSRNAIVDSVIRTELVALLNVSNDADLTIALSAFVGEFTMLAPTLSLTHCIAAAKCLALQQDIPAAINMFMGPDLLNGRGVTI